jgi:two-component sensor histidine kinase/PAS domain-containing protein
MMRKYDMTVRVVGDLAASFLAACRASLGHCRRGTTMQWTSTIDAPMTGSLDPEVDPDRDDRNVDPVAATFGRDLLHVLRAMQEGNFSIRMAGDHGGLAGQIAETVNVVATANQRIAQQLERLGEDLERLGEDFERSLSRGDLGRDGRTARQRIKLGLAGGWGEMEAQLNQLIDRLLRSKSRLQDSEDSRSLALAAGKMGSWDWDLAAGQCLWDAGQRQIFGAHPASFAVDLAAIRALVDRNDWKMLCRQLWRARRSGGAWQLEFRVRRPDGGVRWCLGTALASRDAAGRVDRIRGITMDITERKEAEDRQLLLAREVDHRTKNALAVVHAIVSLTRADNIGQFSASVEGRIQALARAHSLLSDSCWRGAKIADLIRGEAAPFCTIPDRVRMSGRSLTLHPSTVQALALTLHELAANAATYGALSVPGGHVRVAWEQRGDELALQWTEYGGPRPPSQVRAGQDQDGKIPDGKVPDGKIPECPVHEYIVRDGLGTRIIRASVETQLRGHVAFDWRSGGLACSIRIPCQPAAPSSMFGDFLYSIWHPANRRRRVS